MRRPNAQYNLAEPDSVSIKIAARVRAQMFRVFIEEFRPGDCERVLDIGVTSDQSYSSSNYFEAMYPYKENITAVGIDDGARIVESIWPGVNFVCADALTLPFADSSFELVHSSAVLEHVGSLWNQTKMISECLRVSKRGVYLTTPNRWFPIEVHTKMPLIHWLPKSWGRRVFSGIGYEFFAREENLNLMSARQLHKVMNRHRECSYRLVSMRVFGWTSNLVLMIQKL